MRVCVPGHYQNASKLNPRKKVGERDRNLLSQCVVLIDANKKWASDSSDGSKLPEEKSTNSGPQNV